MPILFDELFRSITASAPLTYLDAGARGGLQGPWREADDGRLRVISFEPDASGAVELKAEDRRRHVVVAKGLWNSETEVELHVAETGSTSSVYPPNWELLGRFRRQHGDPRRTVQTQRIQCTTVDRIAAQLGWAIDFLKLDTQGAEFEILEGARDELRRNAFAVLCETWTQPVHRGQRLTHEVWSLLDSMGFEVVQTSVAAAWQHRIVDREQLAGRAQLTGLDLLAFRSPSTWPRLSLVQAAKWAAIAELYGYPDIAVELIDAAHPETEQELLAVSRFREAIGRSASTGPAPPQGGLIERLLRRLRPARKAGGAELHY